jgi:glucose/arabinose dehydrogenase
MRGGTLLGTLVCIAAAVSAAADRTGHAEAPQVWPAIALARTTAGLDRPTFITHAGDGSNRLFVTEQKGRIIVLHDRTPRNKPFLDISRKVSCCGERGLLSTAFPKDYRKKNYFYANYTDLSGDTVVARYRVTADPDIADPGSEEIILSIKQPYANHNGGQLAFGPDGFLYIGMGDGGLFGDPAGNGQKKDALLGKMLRIDVESGAVPYAVPPANPFVNKPGFRPEIWALGLRNPWRFSFDRRTGDLYIADVGQNAYEEVDFQPAASAGGENYGWNIMEGMRCYKSSSCDKAGLTLPVVEYDHGEGCSITGGLVYRAERHRELQGIYFYADYCSGRVWGLRQSGEQWHTKELLKSGLAVSTFGEDEDGNLYLADHDAGALYTIGVRPAGR